jgi:hypothetical protein
MLIWKVNLNWNSRTRQARAKTAPNGLLGFGVIKFYIEWQVFWGERFKLGTLHGNFCVRI